jgi:hypothetical protein
MLVCPVVGAPARNAGRDAASLDPAWLGQAVQQNEPPRRWVIWADPNELSRLRQLHQRPSGDATRRRWVADDSTLAGAACITPSLIG